MFAYVFFDLDDTLHDLAAVQRAAVVVAAGRAAQLWPGVEAQRLVADYFALESSIWDRYISGELDKERYRHELFAAPLRAQLHREPEAAAVAGLTALRVAEMEAHWRAFPDAAPCLARLKGRVGLACLTNGPADNKWSRLRATGLDRFFTPATLFVSETVGWHKPDRRFYAAVLATLGLAPSQAFMVGDNPVTDVAGAQAAGIAAAWLNRAGGPWPVEAPPPAHVLRSLKELPPLLGL